MLACVAVLESVGETDRPFRVESLVLKPFIGRLQG